MWKKRGAIIGIDFQDFEKKHKNKPAYLPSLFIRLIVDLVIALHRA